MNENLLNILANSSMYLTILFVVSILLGILIGIIRGFRKSIILFILMLVALGTSIFVFSTLVANNGEKMYLITNKTLSLFHTDLNSLLNLSVPQDSFHAIVKEYLIEKLSNNQGLQNVAIEMYSQVDPLVQMIIRISCFIVTVVVFYLINLLLYLFVYLIFFREGKYKKKNPTYKKKRVLGGVVGFLHYGFYTLVSFSFLGMIILLLSGGKTEENKVSFNDSNLNTIYDISNISRKIGSSGIFKILNGVKDKNNTPYYMFFIDAVVTGKAEDYNGDVYSVYPRQEVQSLSGLFNDFLDLAATNEFQTFYNSFNQPGADKVELLKELFNNKNFNDQVLNVISNYQATEYLKNIGKIAVSAISNNFEILAKEYFKNDADKYINFYNALFTKTSDDDPYYIAPSDILKFDDLKTILEIGTKLIGQLADIDTLNKSNDEFKSIKITNLLLDSVSSVSKDLSKLSFLSGDTDHTKRINRLISNLINATIDFTGTESSNNLIYNIGDVNWVTDLNNVVNVIKSATYITTELVNNLSPTSNLFKSLDTILNKNYVNYNAVNEAINNVINVPSNLDCLNVILSNALSNGELEKLIKEKTGITITLDKDKIHWINYKDANGKEKEGEISKIIHSAYYLSQNSALDDLANLGSNTIASARDLSSKLILKINNSDQTIIDYILTSELIYSISNTYLQTVSIGQSSVILPPSIYTLEDGKKLINKSELSQLVALFSNILNSKDTNGNYNITTTDDLSNTSKILQLMSNEDVRKNFESSDILTATASKILYEMVSTNSSIYMYIIIPSQYSLYDTLIDENISNWLGTNGEFSKIVNAVIELDLDLDFSKFDKNELFNKILSLDLPSNTSANETKIDVVNKSAILSISLANILVSDKDLNNIIIPDDVKDTQTIYGYTRIISSAWLDLVKGIKYGFAIEDDVINQLSNVSNLISKFFDDDYVTKKNYIFTSEILEYTIVNIIKNSFNSLSTNSSIVIPKNTNYYSTRDSQTNSIIKYGEAANLLDLLKELNFTGDLNKIGANLESKLTVASLFITSSDNEDSKTAKLSLQKVILSSDIFKASIINMISNTTSITNVLQIPSSYKLTKDQIITQYRSDVSFAWNQELQSLFTSINTLALPITNSNITFDINSIIKKSFDMNIVCQSKIIRATISANLLNISNLYFIKTDITTFDDKMLISINELSNFFSAIKIFTASGSFTLQNIKLQSIFNSEYQNNKETLFKSNTLKMTFTQMIFKTFNNSGFILPKEISFTISTTTNIIDLNQQLINFMMDSSQIINHNTFVSYELENVFDVINILGLGNSADSTLNINLDLFVTNPDKEKYREAILKSVVFSAKVMSLLTADSNYNSLISSTLKTEASAINSKTKDYYTSTWASTDNGLQSIFTKIDGMNP